MRYTSAVVLSTLAVGQAVAHNARHASFHARRAVEDKRNIDKVNWNKVSYDVSNVDWDTVDWDSVFNKPTAAPAAAAPPAANYNEVETSQAPAATSTPAYTPAPTTEKEAKPTATESSTPSYGGGDFDFTKGVEERCEELGIPQSGKNDESDNGNIWIGKSDWMANFTNADAEEDVVLFCWASGTNFGGMSLNVNQPFISISIPPGGHKEISFAAGVPSACAPTYSGCELALFGGIRETWAEFTFGQNGAFDVSRNVWMKGSNIEMYGSKCESTLTTCVFQCTGNRDSCEKGYTLDNCNASNGGGGGYDPVMDGVGGGCAMGSSGETIDIKLSRS